MRKKTKTTARSSATRSSARDAKPHAYAYHPAVGLLECGYKDQSGGTTEESRAKICGRDGMDEDFHELPASAYLGPTPRPEPWRSKLHKIDPDQGAKEDPDFEAPAEDEDE